MPNRHGLVFKKLGIEEVRSIRRNMIADTIKSAISLMSLASGNFGSKDRGLGGVSLIQVSADTFTGIAYDKLATSGNIGAESEALKHNFGFHICFFHLIIPPLTSQTSP